MIFILYNGGFSCIFAVIAFQLHRVTGAEEKNEIKGSGGGRNGGRDCELCVKECITKDSQLDFTHSNNNNEQETPPPSSYSPQCAMCNVACTRKCI